jgi:hypothetical protein
MPFYIVMSRFSIGTCEQRSPLDDDVAAELKAESHPAGLPFREIVNERLRWRLENAGGPPPSGGPTRTCNG